MFRKSLFTLGILMLMGTVFAQRADAGLVLRLSAYNTSNVLLGTTTIIDGGAGDSNPFTGAITNLLFNWNNWTLTVTTGLGNPFIPASSTYAELHLDAVATSSAAGKLKIEFGDDNVPAFPQNGVLTGNLSVTTVGLSNSVVADGYKHDNHDLFDTSSTLADVHIGPLGAGGGSFAGTDSDLHGPLSGYKMLQVVTFTHGNGSSITSSIDYSLINAVPVPAGVIMFATGGVLIGGAGWLRRHRISVA